MLSTSVTRCKRWTCDTLDEETDSVKPKIISGLPTFAVTDMSLLPPLDINNVVISLLLRELN